MTTRRPVQGSDDDWQHALFTLGACSAITQLVLASPDNFSSAARLFLTLGGALGSLLGAVSRLRCSPALSCLGVRAMVDSRGLRPLIGCLAPLCARAQGVFLHSLATRKAGRIKKGIAVAMVVMALLIMHVHAMFIKRWGARPNFRGHNASFRPRPSLFFGAFEPPPSTAPTPKLTTGQLNRIAATTGSSYVIFWSLQGSKQVIDCTFATARHLSSQRAEGLNATFAEESELLVARTGGDSAISSVFNTSEPVLFPDVTSSDMERRDLARRYGVRQLALLPFEGGVLELGTSSSLLLSGLGQEWDGADAEAIRQVCSTNEQEPMFVQELQYPDGVWRMQGSEWWERLANGSHAYRYLLSLNNPSEDRVVSHGLLNFVHGPKGTYPSATEVHSICTAPGHYLGFTPEGQVKSMPAGRLVDCEAGKVAVEVGSALGMVSLYLASRGMRVMALDPVRPNVQRMRESRCLNGVRACMAEVRRRGGAGGDAQKHAEACLGDLRLWGNYSQANLRLQHLAIASTSGSYVTIRAHRDNLAATDPDTPLGQAAASGPQTYEENVTTAALDDLMDEWVREDQTLDDDIELLHMCPQGLEVSVLAGTLKMLHGGRVRNILFGVYHDDVKLLAQREASARMTVLLAALGYDFYDTYDCGRANHGIPRCFGPMRFKDSAHVLSYLGEERAEGWHAMLLASLPPVAQLYLKTNGTAVSKHDIINILHGSMDQLAKYDPIWLRQRRHQVGLDVAAALDDQPDVPR